MHFGNQTIDDHENDENENDENDNDDSGDAAVERTLRLFSPVVLGVAVLGVVTNVASIFIFIRQRFRKNFHRLLMILALYDLLVVVFCSMLYSLPSVWPAYDAHALLPLLPYLFPLIHISIMSSVYCTVVLSWERYVRICLVSNLVDCNYFSKGKFRAYIAIIVGFPILFYLPKFFEIRPETIRVAYNETIYCSNLTTNSTYQTVNNNNNNETTTTTTPSSIYDINTDDVEEDAYEDYPECNDIEFEEEFFVNVTRYRTIVSLETWLRKDPLYYHVYCVAANTIFATVIPLVTLTFFNVSTVMALNRIGKQQLQQGQQSFNLTPSNSGKHPQVNGNGAAAAALASATGPATALIPAALDGESAPSVVVNVVVVAGGDGGVGRKISKNGGGNGGARRNSLLRRSNSPVCRRRESRLTRISLSIVWLFLFCHVWKLMPTVYEAFVGVLDEAPVWVRQMQHVSHALIVLNSSLNFLIYVAL